jgi:hypothetical protein
MNTSPLPTVVLVYGAFSDASGFSGLIRELSHAGHTVLAPPNPLRSLSFEADAIAGYVAAIDAPVLLIGHCLRRRGNYPSIRHLVQRNRSGPAGGSAGRSAAP